MERDIHVNDMDSPTENPLLNKVDCQSCISEWYCEELWNFDEAVGMGSWKCQWLWQEGKNNWTSVYHCSTFPFW